MFRSFQYIIQVIFLKGFLGPLMKKDTVAKFKDGFTSKCCILFIYIYIWNLILCARVWKLYDFMLNKAIYNCIHKSLWNKPNNKTHLEILEVKRCI